MSKFSVGDEVRIVGFVEDSDAGRVLYGRALVGMIMRVTSVGADSQSRYDYGLRDPSGGISYQLGVLEREIELVSSTEETP